MNAIYLTLSNIYYSNLPLFQVKKKSYFTIPFERFQSAPQDCHLCNRIIEQLDSAEFFLDRIVPDFFFQQKMDEIGNLIQSTFSPLQEFNQWLDKRGEVNWHKSLATFLCKLPLRVVRNYVSFLYRIICMVLQSAVHPLKAIPKLAKHLTKLIYQFTTQPGICANMGASMVGASLGQAMVANGMISPVGIGIGIGLIAAALSFKGFKAAFNREEKKVFNILLKNELLDQIKQLPEAMLTGLCMGMAIGAIQRQVDAVIQQAYHEGIKTEVNSKLAEYYLPPSSDISLDVSRGVIIKWSLKDISLSVQWALKSYFSHTSQTATQLIVRVPPETANIPPVEVFVPYSLKTGFIVAPVGVSAISCLSPDVG